MIHKEMALMEKLYEALEKIPGIQVYGNLRNAVIWARESELQRPDSFRCGIYPGKWVWNHGTCGLHCSPLIMKLWEHKRTETIRISISYFTKEKDIQEFLTAAEQIAGSVAGR